jgi:hypothetical protein
LRRLQRQYLYFCTSKASKLSTCGVGGRREFAQALQYLLQERRGSCQQ